MYDSHEIRQVLHAIEREGWVYWVAQKQDGTWTAAVEDKCGVVSQAAGLKPLTAVGLAYAGAKVKASARRCNCAPSLKQPRHQTWCNTRLPPK